MQFTRTEIAERIKPIAEQYAIPEVYLFGSYARGEENETSDIDILIKRSGSTIRSAFDIGGLFNDLCNAFEQEVDLVTIESLDPSSNRRGRRGFAETLNSERVLIYEKR